MSQRNDTRQSSMTAVLPLSLKCHPISSPHSVFSPHAPASLSSALSSHIFPWWCASPLACSRDPCSTQAFSLITSGYFLCPLFFFSGITINWDAFIPPLVPCHQYSLSVKKKKSRRKQSKPPSRQSRHCCDSHRLELNKRRPQLLKKSVQSRAKTTFICSPCHWGL